MVVDLKVSVSQGQRYFKYSPGRSYNWFACRTSVVTRDPFDTFETDLWCLGDCPGPRVGMNVLLPDLIVNSPSL